MKIAFFCDAYLPTKNGVATSARTTAQELRSRGHRVIIFAPRYVDYQDDDPDVVRFAAGHWFKARDYPVAFPLLSRVSPRTAYRFARERFDLVHVHSPFVLGNLGAHWARFHFLPLVWTFHTLYHHYAHYSITPPETSRAYILWRIRRMLRKCNRVIAPSNAVERVVLRLWPSAPTRVVPTGVDIARFAGGDRMASRQEWGLREGEVALLYVGRLAPEKNLSFLLKSVAPILKNHNVKLVMVGGGPSTEILKRQTNTLGIAERVIFPGFIEPENINNFYAMADIFTFASRTETQGLSIAEALCAGLPCVVVNAMGAAEAIEPGEDGFLVPPQERRFRAAVEQLVTNPGLRAQMSAHARTRAPRFSKERRVSELLSLYEEAVIEVRSKNAEHFEIV